MKEKIDREKKQNYDIREDSRGSERQGRDKDWWCQFPYDKWRRYEDGRAAKTERLTFPKMPHVTVLLCHSPQNNMSGA